MEFMTKVKISFIAVISVLTLIVFFQNWEPQTAKILFVDVTMPRAVLLIITLLLGMILGFLLSALIRLRKKRREE
jgi:lipopolysaccharide assembly protein A